MARPRDLTPADLAYWEDYEPQPAFLTAPEEVELGVEPCPAIITKGDELADKIVRVPIVLDEIELMHLANGGTLWLSTWSGLPPFMVEVQQP